MNAYGSHLRHTIACYNCTEAGHGQEMLAHRHGTQDLHLFTNIKGEVLSWNERGGKGSEDVNPILLTYEEGVC